MLILLLFGAKRLPDLSRSVGRSLRIFKAETEGLRGNAPTGTTGAPAALPAVTAAPSTPPADAPRCLVDPDTGERVLGPAGEQATTASGLTPTPSHDDHDRGPPAGRRLRRRRRTTPTAR